MLPLSFLRIVTLSGKLLRTVVLAYNVLLRKRKFGIWCMTVLLIACINVVYR